MSIADLPYVVAAIYEAMLDPEKWSFTAEKFCEFFNAPSCHIYLRDLSTQKTVFGVFDGWNGAHLNDYYEHYRGVNPLFALRERTPTGRGLAWNLQVSENGYRESEYYYDFMRNAGRFYSASVTVLKEPTAIGAIGIQRDRHQRAFSPQDIQYLELLGSHVRRAFEINRHLAAARSARASLMGVLEQLQQGVLLLNAAGTLLFVNPRAEHIIAGVPSLKLTSAHLESVIADEAQEIRRLIALAADAGNGESDARGGVLRVFRGELQQPVQLLFSPINPSVTDLGTTENEARVVVFVHNPGVPAPLDRHAVANLFGLTPAEARLAISISAGQSLEEIASRTKRSLNTLRAHLKAVFQKMGVRRQTEIAVALLCSPATLGVDRAAAARLQH